MTTSRKPLCPNCQSTNVLLDSMCAWNGEYWEYESDIGSYFCQECESGIDEDALQWLEGAA